MTGKIITCDHVTYQLPELLEWSICRTGGVPADCFTAVCVYTPEMAEPVHRAESFLALDGNRLLLHGYVDEYEIVQNGAGRLVTLRGRGYICRLMDNESRPITYRTAGLEEIIRNHVIPYGIPCRSMAPLRAGDIYTVPAGISQWKVLTDFCETYGGFIPRFARNGDLLAVPEDGGALHIIGDDTAVLALTKRGDHYGVISEVLVIDKTRGVTQTVKNEDYLTRGGQRRRVVYTPGQSTWAAMRYTGEYQIAKSRENEVEITVKLPGLAEVEPGDTVRLSRSDCGLYGEYRAAEVEYRLDTDGEVTLLTLKERV